MCYGNWAEDRISGTDFNEVPAFPKFWSSTPRLNGNVRCSISKASRRHRPHPSLSPHRSRHPLVSIRTSKKTSRSGKGPRILHSLCLETSRRRSDRSVFSITANIGSRFEGTQQGGLREKILAKRVRAEKTLGFGPESDAKGRAGLLLFRRPHRETFRWKGEHVSTSEVSEAISCVFRRPRQASSTAWCSRRDGRAGWPVVAGEGWNLGHFG